MEIFRALIVPEYFVPGRLMQVFMAVPDLSADKSRQTNSGISVAAKDV
jgi:hypothetical protein